MEDFRGEISTEEAPGAAVRRRIDVVLIAAGNFVDSVRNGATGKYGGILDQGLVGEGALATKMVKLLPIGRETMGPCLACSFRRIGSSLGRFYDAIGIF